MKRYDIFKDIHKGLRALLYETALCIQHTDFTQAEEADTALQQIGLAVDLFEKHAHTEDTIVFPAIIKNEPALVDAFEKEHIEDHVLGLHLNGHLLAFSHAVSPTEKENIGQAISMAFIDFMVFNLKHMAKEEDIVNKALWKYHTDDVLHAIAEQIVGALPPEKMQAFSRCIMRGLNNKEISAFLKRIKDTAPDFVFQSLMEMAAAELKESRWQLIQETITEGAMIA